MEANERSQRRAVSSGSSSGASVSHGEWQRLNEIGKGSFALVYKGVHKTRGTLVAIKSVNKTKLTKKLKENLDEEVKILTKLHHPHIVALFDCLETSTHVHLVMEFCELGDLSSFIKKRSSLIDHEATRDMMLKYPNPVVGGLNEVICRHFLKQISSALEYLHARNFLHRDIKPQNLLLLPSKNWYDKHRTGRQPLLRDTQVDAPPAGIVSLPQLKIADFGFARFLPSLSMAETLCGSPLYMAPEILSYQKYDNKADLWSVGTVLHEMVVGKPPFRASNHVELLRKIEKAEDRIKFPEGSEISPEMKVAIRALLKKNPLERISYENFFALDAVTKPIPGLVAEDASPVLNLGNQDALLGQTAVSEATKSLSPPPQVIPAATPVSTSRPSSRRLSTASGKQPVETQDDSVVTNKSPPSSPRPRDRRPALTSTATAPPRTSDRRQSLGTVVAEKSIRDQPPSMLKAHLDQQRGVPADERSLREVREKAAQDIAFERDYVLIEKRAVEVNAFADELGHSPLVQQGTPHQPGAMIRRATTAGIPLSTTAPSSTGARAMQILGRQNPLHQRTSSYDKRYGRSPVGGAITKALNMANQRLFGIGLSPPPATGSSPPRGYNAFPTYPTAQSSVLMIGSGGRTIDPRDDDLRVAMLLEDLATRSDVVWGFAEVKYQQLLPTRPQSPQGFGFLAKRKSEQAVVDDEDDGLTVDAVIVIAEEALVLYVKALAVLARVIDIAGSWWGKRNRGAIISSSPQSAPVRSGNGQSAMITSKINGIVQWSRNRFNECLEKSEFVGRKLQEAQKQLPADHPAHPDNHPQSSVNSSTGVGTSAENFQLTTGVTAEKLMYDRALEMSRTAAVNELMNAELEAGEVSYRTAICMLEAILDNDEDRTGRASTILRKELKEDEQGIIDGLESEDRAAVKKLLEGLRQRLKSLKKKLEAQKANSKRQSITAPPSSTRRASSKQSPSATPGLAVTPPTH